MPDTATKVKRSNNPVKRAFRKIGKIRKRAPPPSTDTTASASDPPKVQTELRHGARRVGRGAGGAESQH